MRTETTSMFRHLHTGLILSRARFKAGLSGSQVMDYLTEHGLPYTSLTCLYRWESSSVLPSLDVLTAMSRLYGIDVVAQLQELFTAQLGLSEPSKAPGERQPEGGGAGRAGKAGEAPTRG